ncbi:MAG: GTP cyclohydrolase II [Rhodospirillaceae bacterium]
MPLATEPSCYASTLRTVDRARVALRCGEVVAIDDGEGRIALTLAVETLTAEGLALLHRLTGAPPVLALTRWRAAALGLVTPGGPGVVALAPAGPLSAAAIHALVEPGRTSLRDEAAPALFEADPHAVAAVRLTKLAALLPTAVVAAAGPRTAAAAWSRAHDLRLVGTGEIAGYRRQEARALRRVADARVPLADAPNAKVIAFRPSNGGHEHLAIVIGTPRPGQPVLVRMHSECFTGDLLGSLRCDCGEQLRRAIAAIAEQGHGLVLYLAQEGRGIGLVNKLRAYQLQDEGYDTLDANEALGFDADERLYLPAAEILHQLGFDRVRLMTNNPDKMAQLARCGIEVTERVPHIIPSNDHNAAYLRAKAQRAGHLF